MSAPEEDFSALPLTDRIVHKQWKVRLQAYDDMTKQFTASGSESDGCFRPFSSDGGQLLKKIVTDSNVAAQEAALKAVLAFLEFGGTPACLKTRAAVVPSIVEKALTSTRAGTRQNASDALLWYVELDSADPVISEILPFWSHKTPKVIAAAINAVLDILKSFGAAGVVNAKPLIEPLVKVFGHADKNVRAAAAALAVELYKWLGDPFARVFLTDLKPVQQKELQEQFEQVKDTKPHQLRYLKSQQGADADAQLAATGGSEAAGSAPDPADEEELDFADPVDISAKIPSSLAESLASSKWKDRKEALEQLLPIVSVPKIADTFDMSDLNRMLGKCIQKDANVQVASLAANCVEALASGLKPSKKTASPGFGKYQSIVVAPLLERCKEKKASVLEAMNNALVAVYKTSTLGEILDTVLEYCQHKTPQIKIESAKFLASCLSTTKTVPTKEEVGSISNVGVKLLSDTQEPVRTAGAEVLGVLMKMVGERALNPALDGVDDIKKSKVKDFAEKATVVAKPAKPSASPAAQATSAPARPAASASTLATKRPRSIQPGLPSTPNKPPSKMAAPGSSRPTSSAIRLRSRLAGSPAKVSSPTREQFAQPSEKLTSASTVTTTTRRPLSIAGGVRRPVTSTIGAVPSLSPSRSSMAPATSPTLSTRDQAELESLRREKAEWLRERELMQHQVVTLEQDKSELQRKVEQLSFDTSKLYEEHTRDVLAIKSRETQLVRTNSDLDSAKARISKLEAELQRMSLDSANAPAVTGFRATSNSDDDFHLTQPQARPRDSLSSPVGSRPRPISMLSTPPGGFSGSSKRNTFHGVNVFDAMPRHRSAGAGVALRSPDTTGSSLMERAAGMRRELERKIEDLKNNA